MSKKPDSDRPAMRDEYEFDGGVRGKYSSRFEQGSNVVILDPDVAEVFRDPQAVNEALRILARSAHASDKAS